ncbi:hypothetical protein QQ056_11040 [Oscillatoria laete-virens NRMC-F 0139]|nr:hypothetical protein [Oscillatoria laete-virens]MDL5054075.1 hypothetical protein [Oscillatoria laete-virens NRMC-F 0139]
MADFSPHEAPARQPSSLSIQLPAKLIGRDVTAGRIYTQLKENRPVLLYGMSGIGKTALAGMVASAYTELSGGAVWLDVRDASLAELIARIGRAYQIEDITSAENPAVEINAARALLTREKPLIVLDGSLNAMAASEFITRAAPGVPVLMVNDEEIPGEWTSLRLGKLDPEYASALYKQISGITDQNLDTEINDLVKTLNYIPLAIAIAAGSTRANRQTPKQFMQALPVGQSAAVNAQLLALTVAFRLLPNALQGLLLVMGATPRGGASAELLELIANASEETVSSAMSQLVQRQLVFRTSRYGGAYYSLHPIIYTFAQTWLKGAGKLRDLQTKVLDSVLIYARKHSHPDQEDHDRLAAEMDTILASAQAASDNGDKHAANQLAAALAQAGDFIVSRGYTYEHEQLRRLAASSQTAFPAYGTSTSPLPLLEEEPEPQSSSPAVLSDDDDDEPDLLEDDDILTEDDLDEDLLDEDDDDLQPHVLPHEELDEDYDEDDDILTEDDLDEDLLDEDDDEDFDEDDEPLPFDGEEDSQLIEDPMVVSISDETDIPRLRTILMQARQAGDRRRQAEALMQIGGLQEQNEQDNEAITSFSEALTVYEALDDKPGMLTALEQLSRLTSRTGTSTAAILHATRGAALAEQIHNSVVQMRLLTILGDERQQLGESDLAIRAYMQALGIAKNAADARSQAVLEYKLGYAQLDSGDPEAAINTWKMAIERFRTQGRRDYEGRVFGGIGTAHGEQARWAEAIQFFKSALHIAREVGDKDEEALQLNNLAYAFVMAHEAGMSIPNEGNLLGQAVLRYRQALHLAYETNSRENIVSTTVDLARLLLRSARHRSVAELLIDSALSHDPTDRDLRKLKEKIMSDRISAPHEETPVDGSARDYAANAYALLNG